MIASLQEMIAPLTAPEFLHHLRVRQPAFQRNVDESRFEGLLDWDTLREVIGRGVLAQPDLTVTRQEEPVPPMLYRGKDKINIATIDGMLRQGGSVIARNLDRHVPALGRLCDDIRTHVADDLMAAAIVSTGESGAIPLHFDISDIGIMQVEGSKHWTIYDTPATDPVEGVTREKAPKGRPMFDDVLRPGDFILVPAGYWHHCRNGPGRSLHVGILITPDVGWHAIRGTLRQLLEDELFRAPLSRFVGAEERAAHEAELKRRLIERIREMSFFDAAPGASRSPGGPPVPASH